MKKQLILLAGSVLFCNQASAATNIMKSLYVADFDVGSDTAVEEGFTLEGEFGFLTASGNTNAASIKGALSADQETQNWSNQYRLEMLYKESEVEREGENIRDVTAQRFYSTVQMDYKLGNPDHRLFVFGEYDNNRFSAYQYQAAIAAGWAQKAIDEDDYQFRYSIGPGYGIAIDHDGDTDNENHGFIVRASVEYKQQLATGAKLRQFLSTEANSDATRSRSETSISAQIMDSLAMKLSFIMNYNSGMNDAGQDNLDTETSIALVYQFF
ncbi:DUF481 domain-containing protein [Alteromonas sp. ASW11-36]|uniref:DUF481 domain-containing protein n=1 Tax=Alteromonas arenosi TaxID=3055817 RepID=A0ABT7SVI7_9ALTE|nr:DUF481 domain-containing protein [Alteromonas sp. ASW11-36]MDM7859559.1 DUF481 domain-containing protein [Alteromonas sp. ASW11-36]